MQAMYLGLGDIIPAMDTRKEKDMEMEWTLGLHRGLEFALSSIFIFMYT